MTSCKTFVVNLKRDKSKRDLFVSTNSAILGEFEIIDAVDGSVIDVEDAGYSKEKSIRYIGREMSNGEVGCYLSHMKIYQRMVDENIPYALILEDDVRILDPDIDSLVDAILNKKYWDLFILYKYRKNRLFIDSIPIGKVGKYTYYIATKIVWGTPAYLVTIKAAKKLLKYKHDIYMPIDMLGRTWRERFLNMLFIKPSAVYVDRSGSEIEQERKDLISGNDKNEHN